MTFSRSSNAQQLWPPFEVQVLELREKEGAFRGNVRRDPHQSPPRPAAPRMLLRHVSKGLGLAAEPPSL